MTSKSSFGRRRFKAGQSYISPLHMGKEMGRGSENGKYLPLIKGDIVPIDGGGLGIRDSGLTLLCHKME